MDVTEWVFFEHISQGDFLYRAIKTRKTKLTNLLFQIFELLCDRKVNQLTDVISKLDLDSKNVQIEQEEFGYIIDLFMYGFCNKIHSNLFTVYANMSKERGKADEARLKELKKQTASFMKLYFRTISKITACIIKLFKIINETTQKVTKEVINNLHGSKNLESIKSKFVNYYTCLFNVLEHQPFLEQIHLFVA